MFEKLATTPTRKSTPKIELTLTKTFLECVQKEGHRLSYAALAGAARILGEDSSKQIAAQRGSTLVKSLPLALQPFVCRKSGGYAKGMTWAIETPSDLRDRPVITASVIGKAVKIWQKATKA